MPKPAILEKEYTHKNTKAVVIDKSRDDLRDSQLYTGQKTWRDKKKKKVFLRASNLFFFCNESITSELVPMIEKKK